MTPYDPDRLVDDLHSIPVPELTGGLAEAAVAEAGRRRARRISVAAGAAVIVVAAAVATPLWWPDRTPLGTVTASPSPVPTVTTPSPTASTPPASPTAEPSPTASGTPTRTPAAVPDKVVTQVGVGELQVGMTLTDGMAAGLATDQGELCGPYDVTEANSARYPSVWQSWTKDGLRSLAIDDDHMPPADHLDYATEQGIRIGSTLAELEAAYPDAQPVGLGEDAWGPLAEGSLPGAGMTGEAYALENEGRALVFFVQDDAVTALLVTTRDGDGLLVPMMSC
ncbi:hypothetical protein [Propioniciclava sp.]|uniref:hypothetical protein n=1 Tax=Propioniciclava sp. TaxID=2038686 RepID=UPI002633906E|nr:hypothetical protein [Propioniciclava sp.]